MLRAYYERALSVFNAQGASAGGVGSQAAGRRGRPNQGEPNQGEEAVDDITQLRDEIEEETDRLIGVNRQAQDLESLRSSYVEQISLLSSDMKTAIIGELQQADEALESGGDASEAIRSLKKLLGEEDFNMMLPLGVALGLGAVGFGLWLTRDKKKTGKNRNSE